MTKGEIARQKAFENETRSWSRGMEGRQYDMYQDLQGRFGRKPSHGSGDEDEENLYESLDYFDRSKDDDGLYKFGGLKISVQQGDITAQNTECIVNSSNETLDLSRGNVSQAIWKKGGKFLEMEVNDKRKKMKKDHLVMTSAPGMSCQKIIHVVAKETPQEWQDIIEKCLFKADKEHMKDIAFPALGTGIQIEASVIATRMAKAILNFAKTYPKFLQKIRLVIFQKQMVGEFDKAISKASQHNEVWDGKLVRSVKDWFGGGEQGQSSRGQIKEKHAKNQDQNKVTFIILAMSEHIIDQAISKLETCLDKEITSYNFNDSIIKHMNEQQIMEIKNVAAKHHLDVKVESSKGIIQITGISASVSKAADNIHRILQHAITVEQERKTAELMINLVHLVQWIYIEAGETGQTLKPYDKEMNYKIEYAYLSKADNFKFRFDKFNYTLDFSKMVEFLEDDPNDSVTVIRRDLVRQGAFEAPALWADMIGNLSVQVLQQTSPEYTEIAQKFTTSSGGTFTVVKIERIQNKTLLSQYQAKKKQLEDKNPPNTTNERLLWHGTAAETVDNINAFGFNRSYCGKNATVFGDGVYFAVNASYPCSNTYSRPDPSGVKRMYYCRVLTGEYTQGTRGMRVPPIKGGAGSTAIFDSVVDRQDTPIMFIIFHDTQAYPEYLISFKPQ